MKYTFKLIFAPLLLFLKPMALPAQVIDLESGLIAHYTFDSSAMDALGINNGRIYDVLPDSGTCGSQSYRFNGTTSYIDCGNDKSLNDKFDGLSISTWIKYLPTDSLSLSTIIAKWAFDPREDQFGLWLDATGYVLFAVSEPGTMEQGTFSVQKLKPGTWYNITVTWNKDREMRIYINGNLDQTGFQRGSGINHNSTVSLKIGREIIGKDRPFKGNIDEIRIYKRTLNIREVEYIYKEGYPRCGNIYIKGQVFNKKTGRPIPGTVEFDYMDSGKKFISTETHGEESIYEATLPGNSSFAFYARADSFLSVNESINTGNIPPDKVVIKNLFLVPVEAGEKISINNIFFDLNKASLKKESYSELDRIIPLFTRFPNLKIEIAGHTDSTGSTPLNLRLSEERAKTVMNYFISRGVDKNRIIARGYGESQPIAPNNTEEGRAKNRRVEFRILEK